MVVWSSFCKLVSNASSKPTLDAAKRFAIVPKRCMSSDHGPRIFPLTPSRFQWNKYKDVLHFYFMIGLIPIGITIFLSSIFVGPAQLRELPEDYIPKYWEYHRNPISRFLARYICTNPQQEYEKYLHFVYEENEKKLLKLLERKIKEKMAERNDYQAYYYQPATAKYLRISKDAADYLESVSGEN